MQPIDHQFFDSVEQQDYLLQGHKGRFFLFTKKAKRRITGLLGKKPSYSKELSKKIEKLRYYEKNNIDMERIQSIYGQTESFDEIVTIIHHICECEMPNHLKNNLLYCYNINKLNQLGLLRNDISDYFSNHEIPICKSVLRNSSNYFDIDIYSMYLLAFGALGHDGMGEDGRRDYINVKTRLDKDHPDNDKIYGYYKKKKHRLGFLISNYGLDSLSQEFGSESNEYKLIDLLTKRDRIDYLELYPEIARKKKRYEEYEGIIKSGDDIEKKLHDFSIRNKKLLKKFVNDCYYGRIFNFSKLDDIPYINQIAILIKSKDKEENLDTTRGAGTKDEKGEERIFEANKHLLGNIKLIKKSNPDLYKSLQFGAESLDQARKNLRMYIRLKKQNEKKGGITRNIEYSESHYGKRGTISFVGG